MSELERPETLAAAVRNFIGDAIIQGEFQPGASLPEVPLAKRLKISRGTVREALRSLQDVGLVEIEAHRGAIVPKLTSAMAEDIQTLRAELESWAARLAVERGLITPDRVKEMTEALDRIGEAHASGDQLATIERDMEFHSLLASYCGHELLLEHLASLRMQTRRVIFYARLFDAVRDPISDHAHLLEALASGDPDVAEQTVRDHIKSSGDVLLARMKSMEGNPG